MTRRRGFTLLELLVVIGIVGLLVGIAFVALKGVRAQAGRAESLGSLRQMIMAHVNYGTDHKATLIPGYMHDSQLNTFAAANEPVWAKLPNGQRLTDCSGDRCDSSSWVWRLLPYMGDNWEALLTDYNSESFVARIDQEIIDGIYGPGTVGASNLGMAETPSFGMNSVYVGGDSFHGGGEATARDPWQNVNPKIAATRLSEVLNPARLVVFGPAGLVDPDLASPSPYLTPNSLDFSVGYCELRAPFMPDAAGDLIVQQWRIGSAGVSCPGWDAENPQPWKQHIQRSRGP